MREKEVVGPFEPIRLRFGIDMRKRMRYGTMAAWTSLTQSGKCRFSRKQSIHNCQFAHTAEGRGLASEYPATRRIILSARRAYINGLSRICENPISRSRQKSRRTFKSLTRRGIGYTIHGGG